MVEIAIINSMQTVSRICFCTDSNVGHECICLKVFIPINNQWFLQTESNK